MTDGTKQRVAIVANDRNSNVHNRLSTIFKDTWVTGDPIKNLNDFWDVFEGNETDPSTGLPFQEALSVFVTLDSFYDPTSDQENADFFIQTLAALSDTIMVVVIDTGKQNSIKTAFNRAIQEQGKSSEIYFISPQEPGNTFLKAADAYNQRQNLRDLKIVGDVGNVDINHKAVTLTVTSAKGGTGKSTVSQLLAAQIALGSKKAGSPQKVAVVDMDTYDSQLGFVINTMRPTALNIKASGDIGPKAIDSNMVYSEMLGCYCLLAPIRGSNADDVDAAFYTPVINNMKAMFDYIVLDTSVQYHDELIPNVCFKLSDGIIYVTDQDLKSVGGMSRWMRHVTGSVENGGYGVRKDMVGVVINKALASEVHMSLDQIRKATDGSRVLGAIPADIGSFIGATNQHSISSLLTQSAPISEAYHQLAQAIVGRDVPLASLYEGGL